MPSPGDERKQLSNSMEHLRGYVTVEGGQDNTIRRPGPATPEEPARPSPDIASLSTSAATEQACAQAAPEGIPPQRSHDPNNNMKRSDPFQFGSRFLEEGDNVFEFNAWDHVETDEAYRQFAAEQFQRQREAPVSAHDMGRFNTAPEKWWNTFYSNNSANFFKDRKWLFHEFPLLAEVTSETAPPTTILEVGAGAGNTAYPLLAQSKNARLKIHACDYSKKAVEIIRANERYDDGASIVADVWDITGREDVSSTTPGASAVNTGTPAGVSLPPGVAPGSVDVVLLIFIFSALAPAEWAQAVRNVWAALRPGGTVLFRDYARGDLAQVRFKKGRYMGENFYVRGDGTRVYFFDEGELESIWTGEEGFWRTWAEAHGKNEKEGEGKSSGGEGTAVGSKESTSPEHSHFVKEKIAIDNRLLVNRKRQLKMYRSWIQARFRKPE